MTLEERMQKFILVTCHCTDLGSASDWLKQIFLAAQLIRSTSQIWVEGMEFLCSFFRGHFAGKPVVKCRLYSQAKPDFSLASTNRVCARRPCWRSKTIKLFSFGKKFNSHANIFLLFTPPTWPPRTDSITVNLHIT